MPGMRRSRAGTGLSVGQVGERCAYLRRSVWGPRATSWKRYCGLSWSSRWRAYRQIEPSTDQASAAYRQSLAQPDELDDARAVRLLLARSGLPVLMWAVLIVGSQITVGFSFLFGVKNLVRRRRWSRR